MPSSEFSNKDFVDSARANVFAPTYGNKPQVSRHYSSARANVFAPTPVCNSVYNTPPIPHFL